MCGIFGIASHNGRVPVDVLQRATESLAHRGPDDGGTIIVCHDVHRNDAQKDNAHKSVEIGLGNRRLAILDLSPLGHQPMRDPETGNWIVYNGEIYNFRDIRGRLERQGFAFRSRSDTEVILKSYACWGEKCLQEFRGMFAFALWDARRHCLFLARDPMGIKPLYFFQSGQYFIFSSEVRPLLGTGLVPRRIDPNGLAAYLTFGSLYDPHTLIEGVRAVGPGHFLTWQAGKIRDTEYWSLSDAETAGGVSRTMNGNHRDQCEDEIAGLLDQSVRMQTVSDVPIGIFLSGGIDSSALVAILNRNEVRPATFSIVFREADYSEAEYSRAVAEQFHTDHHEITVSQADFFAAIDPAISAMDLPTIDGINTYFVSERTRTAGLKVALSGLGGDEMFAGYSSFRTVPRLQKLARTTKRIPHALRVPLASAFAMLAPSNDQNRKLTALSRNSREILHPYCLSRMLFVPHQQDELWAGTTGFDTFEPFKENLREILEDAKRFDVVNSVSYLEARCYMQNTLLRDSDFMSMAHGLEVRVPLIDHQLARRTLSLPGSWKLNGKTPKPLLLRALRAKLPEKIVHRPKRGFTMPFEHWLRSELRSSIQQALRCIDDGPLAKHLSQPAAVHVWNDFLAGRTSWSRPWSLYVLQRWSERHLSC
jgi:asparagine synthase (glutamine-hydrolysing)